MPIAIAISLFLVECRMLWGIGATGTTWGSGVAIPSLLGFLLVLPVWVFFCGMTGSSRLGQILFASLGIFGLVASAYSIFHATDWGSPIDMPPLYPSDPAMQALLVSLAIGAGSAFGILRSDELQHQRHFKALVIYFASASLGFGAQFLEPSHSSFGQLSAPLAGFKGWLWALSNEGVWQDGKQVTICMCLILLLGVCVGVSALRRRSWAWIWLFAPLVHRILLAAAWPSFHEAFLSRF
jgi:hypothetical protein